MRALLNEKFVSENHESMLAFIERMKKNPETTSPWDAPKPNWGIAGFQGDLFKIIDELISCTEFALNSPELAGSGRGRAYLPRRVSPQQYCAFNVAAAILHFHDPDQRPKGKKAETYAEKLWEASTTALGPTVKFEGNRDKKTLITWRHYFHPDCYKDGFCAFEECRLGLGTAAYFGESETSHK
jgi:hypothetical protein